MSNHQIKLINSKDTYKVRHSILRTGKPIASCVFDNDDLKTTFHLGLYVNNQIIGICSFFKNNHNMLLQEPQYQLRGMAILKAYQGHGFGHKILDYGENLLREKKVKTVWCNARKSALPFYTKQGYQILGEPFIIVDIGLHYLMHKTL